LAIVSLAKGDESMKLSFDQICKDYAGRLVLNNLTGEINEGDIIGLVGANGAGKTTLAKILAGVIKADSGRVECFPNDARVLYLDQYPVFEDTSTVFEEVLRSLTDRTDGENSKWNAEATVRKCLNRMGLEEKLWFQKASGLSGGEKTKLSLCKAMVSEYDFLLLDEPSNHLDVESCQQLEDYIRNLGKPVLAISHDRYFLDAVTNKIWELSSRGLAEYKGNYSDYKQQKEIEDKNAERAYNKQQTQIEQLKSVINERKSWYASAHKAAGQNDFARSKAKKHAKTLKAKERQLERLEKNKLERPRVAPSPAFEIINKGILGNKLPPTFVCGKNIVKSYGDNIILDNTGLNINRGDKIALIGKNGSGKSTLLKMICGLDTEFSGSISLSPAVRVGYFAQELDNLDESVSILDYLIAQGTSVGEARLLLACLLFRGDAVFKKIGRLSMGEKGRVAFASLILSGANMLVLDEPTNYMDIQSRERIEDVLEEYAGVILFVSHDRYFIQRLANKVIQIEGKKLITYHGGYRYYLDKCKEKKEIREFGDEFNMLSDNIRRLECRLAFLSGQLNSVVDEAEKEKLDQEFISTARELKEYKQALGTKLD